MGVEILVFEADGANKAVERTKERIAICDVAGSNGRKPLRSLAIRFELLVQRLECKNGVPMASQFETSQKLFLLFGALA